MWALDNTNQYIRLLWAHYLCHESCWFSESDREILTNIYMTSSISLTSLIPQPSSWQSTMAYCKKVSCEVSHHVLFKLEPHGFHKQKWCSWLKEIACIVRDPIKIHTHTIPKSVYEKWHFLYRKHHDYSVKCKETRRAETCAEPTPKRWWTSESEEWEETEMWGEEEEAEKSRSPKRKSEEGWWRPPGKREEEEEEE